MFSEKPKVFQNCEREKRKLIRPETVLESEAWSERNQECCKNSVRIVEKTKSENRGRKDTMTAVLPSLHQAHVNCQRNQRGWENQESIIRLIFGTMGAPGCLCSLLLIFLRASREVGCLPDIIKLGNTNWKSYLGDDFNMCQCHTTFFQTCHFSIFVQILIGLRSNHSLSLSLSKYMSYKPRWSWQNICQSCHLSSFQMKVWTNVDTKESDDPQLIDDPSNSVITSYSMINWM